MRRAIFFARRLTRSSHGQAGLFALSAGEAFFPFLMEVVMAPMMLVNRRRAWRIGAIALAGCIVGSLAAYCAGAWLYEVAGEPLVAVVGGEEVFADFKRFMQDYGFWAIIAAGVTPIPFQVAILAGGVTGYPLTGFVAAVLVARGVRYLGLAALIVWLGADAMKLFSRMRRLSPLRKARRKATLAAAEKAAAVVPPAPGEAENGPRR
ncbi:MAG: DedA family protein [Alphaproteobacteria bacterium]|nr:DedA family protein [Alphaproteobacteria bacterium]